jgi:MerR family copper efflux transcriptional regulator
MTTNHRLPLFAPPAASTVSADASDDVEVQVVRADAEQARHAEQADQVGHAEPDGELMQVGDLAKEAGKTVRAIHLYEELQLLKPAARSKGRYRLYNRAALVRIRWIGKLQDMGFSLTDIQSVVRDWEDGASASTTMRKMREVYEKKLEETRAHLARLQSLAREIEASLSYLETCDDVCDPERLLSFCKKCELHGCHDHVPDLVAGFRVS